MDHFVIPLWKATTQRGSEEDEQRRDADSIVQRHIINKRAAATYAPNDYPSRILLLRGSFLATDLGFHCLCLVRG